MTLRLYNTMSRGIESFEPVSPPRVTLYSCGPTVWNYAHIGNFRTFLFVDLLRRWLDASGYEVYHIMNLTDVDDRIIREAARAGTTIDRLVAPYIEAFYADRDYLRIRPAHAYPRATEFIEPMIRLVAGLLEHGTAYSGEDGSVYFSIARFPAYGRLSRLDTREIKEGASGRVATDEYDKENARDFVLWKAVKPEDEAAGAAWDSPFGRGRPGWHLECSAMALDLIGRQAEVDVLDIHTGGVDLIFPHHEDEIAQSCAFTGQADFARYWLHGAFLQVKGEKMSKRFGNVVTARALREDGVDPAAIRLLMYQTHYRQELNLTEEALGAAREGSQRLGELNRRLRSSIGDPGGGFAALMERTDLEFARALDDDLNAPVAVSAIFDFVREANRLLDAGEAPGPRVLAHWGHWVADVLDLIPEERTADEDLAAWVTQLIADRAAAKSRRDFAEADAIRARLRDRGIVVEDTPQGTLWRMA